MHVLLEEAETYERVGGRSKPYSIAHYSSTEDCWNKVEQNGRGYHYVHVDVVLCRKWITRQMRAGVFASVSFESPGKNFWQIDEK